MDLRGIDFGKIWGASGVQGFFGEGYRFHTLFKPLGLDFGGITFVAKTTTLAPNLGNMPLRADFTPSELKPKCIVVRPIKGAVLNAVGLSGPGAEALLRRGFWQTRTQPFFLSFMSIGKTKAERLEELRRFVILLAGELHTFKAKIGLQINFSCPNVGVHIDELRSEIEESLEIVSRLEISIILKLNVLFPVAAAVEISRNPHCDGICISNSIPWGALSDEIDWESIFGTKISPLAHLGGGGLSSADLLPLVANWVWLARQAGFSKHINAGGGIRNKDDVDFLFRMGASSVFVGSVVIVRPWRVRGIKNHVNRMKGR